MRVLPGAVTMKGSSWTIINAKRIALSDMLHVFKKDNEVSVNYINHSLQRWMDNKSSH